MENRKVNELQQPILIKEKKRGEDVSLSGIIIAIDCTAASGCTKDGHDSKHHLLQKGRLQDALFEHRAVLIPYIYFYTDISALNITRYRYQSDISHLQMIHTFITYFSMVSVTSL